MTTQKTTTRSGTSARKTSTKKTATKKMQKKGPAKKSAAKKRAGKGAARKTSAKTTAQKKVKKVMHERKAGTLRSGKSGKKVTSRKQAIAIGLSEARKAGAKVPKNEDLDAVCTVYWRKVKSWTANPIWKSSLLNKLAAFSSRVEAPPLSTSKPRSAWRCLGWATRFNFLRTLQLPSSSCESADSHTGQLMLGHE